MITRLSHVTILVRDYDEALRFWTETMGFTVKSDQTFGPGARWLTVAPPGQEGLEIVLQKPEPAMHGEAGSQRMLQQVGQGTTWVFETEDCQAAYEKLTAKGVRFAGPPAERPYGMEAVFYDPYGNPFVLMGRK